MCHHHQCQQKHHSMLQSPAASSASSLVCNASIFHICTTCWMSGLKQSQTCIYITKHSTASRTNSLVTAQFTFSCTFGAANGLCSVCHRAPPLTWNDFALTIGNDRSHICKMSGSTCGDAAGSSDTSELWKALQHGFCHSPFTYLLCHVIQEQ